VISRSVSLKEFKNQVALQTEEKDENFRIFRVVAEPRTERFPNISQILGQRTVFIFRVEVSKNGIETFNSGRGEREKDHGE